MSLSRVDALRAMGLDGDATEAAIKRRYHQLAKAAHPDSQGGSAEQFALVQAVYLAARSQPVPASKAREFKRRDTVADLCEIAATVADVMKKPKVAAALRNALTRINAKG